MRPLFLAFILCLFFLPTIQAIAQKKDQVGFSSIQFQLKGNYPKDFDLQSFGKGDALTGCNPPYFRTGIQTSFQI